MSLKDLIDTIDWLLIAPASRGYITKMPTDTISVKFSPKNKKSTLIEKVFLRIGKDILEEIGLKDKDRLIIYNDPDDLLTFLICKSDNGVGYSISVDKKGKGHGRLSFHWPHTKLLRLKEINIHSVKYETYKNYLSFRAEKPDDE